MVYKEIEWKNYKGVLLPLTAQHHSVNLSKKEQNELLKKSGVHLIKWVNEWDNPLPTNYWYVIKDSFGGLAELKSNMRNQVRKGLKLCEVRKIDADFLLKNGYLIYKNAHIHYQQKSNSPIKMPTEESFKNIYKKIATVSEFWGVFEKESNQFIAFAENVIRDRGVVYGSMKFDPAYLKLYPSYSLIHTMNQYYLEDCKMRYVSDGPRALSHETQIQDMLIRKFNFRKAYCKLNLAFSPFLEFTVSIFYPLRNIVYSINQKHFKELSVVLKMAEIVKNDGK